MGNSREPNIILFFTDQQRWDTLECYGGPKNISPNLDEIARRGVLFENAFTIQPLCGPARASILTGRYPTSIGCYRNGIPLPENEKTIAHYLKEKGYEVSYIGKWHLGGTEKGAVPFERRGGFVDYWLAANRLEHTSHPYEGILFDIDNNPVEFTNKYRVDALTDFALDYLKKYRKKEPFFLFLSYLEPHFQNDMRRFIAPNGYAENYRNAPIPQDLLEKDGDWKENMADYYGMCKKLDESVGRIFEEIKTLGIEDNTIFVFTSDHGCHFKTRNKEYKRSCHESSIRVPLIIYGPGFEGGRRIKEIVSLIDLLPTFLEIVGISVPSNIHGKSFLPLIKGINTDWRKELFIQISESEVGRALRTEEWKYSVFAPNKDGIMDSFSDVYMEECLYNLKNDPYEQDNLINKPGYEEIRKELAYILKKKMIEVGEREPKILPIEDH